MTRRPDFIIIGAMKSATTTLHNQLAAQAGIYMTNKEDEPNYFSDDDRYKRGICWYESLFDRASSGALRGESSTHYTMLPTYPQTVDRMRRHLDDVRIIYVMRHPIERLISHFIHEWSQRVIEVPIDEAMDRHHTLTSYSQYARQLEPFIVAYGWERVLPVFFESLVARPQRELERICHFIGYTQRPLWEERLAKLSVSAARLRRSGARDVIVNAPLIGALRRKLIPQFLRNRVKRLWLMDKRPKLSLKAYNRVRSVFDQDLARLGSWLGVQVTCDNFKETALSGVHDWIEVPEVTLADTSTD